MLIVGAGPVGLTAAIDLASRGVDVVVAELRREGEPPSPKCNHVVGALDGDFPAPGRRGKLREAGLPADYPNDISYRTTFTGIELARIPIPCRRDRYVVKDGPDGWWPTPEPPHRINQIYLEPILLRHAAAIRTRAILSRTSIDAVEQGEDGVLATARDLDSGDHVDDRVPLSHRLRRRPFRIRRAIGATFAGDAVIQRVQSTYLRAPDLISRQRHERAWGTASRSIPVAAAWSTPSTAARPGWCTTTLRAEEADFDAVDRDWAIRTILGVGSDFRYDILSREDWFGRRLVADRFRDRRIFICGDAAHIWVPFAGYGMNAGIEDAANLAWLLAAHLDGWAPAAILDAYERERQPITTQVSRFAMDHALKEMHRRSAVPEGIEEPDAAGDRLRAELGAATYALNVQQYCCAGLNFGCFYDASPLIAYDGEAAPGYTMGTFTPSTVPGCRAPHFWLADGRSLYDALGDGYTLLRLDASLDVSALRAASAHRAMPLTVLDVPATADPAYRHALVLVRPDQHVAWRGQQLPADPLALVDLVRGAGPMG